MKYNLKRTLLAMALTPAVTLAASSALAQAAQPPDISNALRELPAPAPLPRETPPLPAIGNMQAEPPLRAANGQQIAVKTIQVVGNASIATAELQELVKPAENRTLSIGELEAVASRITGFYRSRGYFVARAYLPEQEVTTGVIRIRVVEGRYGKFRLENTSLVKDEVVQGLLDAAKGSGVVSTETIERAMLNINGTPGAVVRRADIMPGQEVGTSDFLVAADATERVTGFATVDNYGSAYTGKKRVMAGADIHSPLGYGDKLSLVGLLSEGGYLKNYRAAYSALLAYNGLRGELANSRTTYQLTDTYAALDALGTADTLEATLAYPFRRTQALTLEGSLNLAHRKLRDEIRVTSVVTPKTADVMTATLSARSEDALWSLPAQSTVSAAVTLGRLDIDDPAARVQDALGADTRGRYGKVNLSLTRLTRLERQWTLHTGLRLQHALFGKNLDGSEQMAVSGVYGVKAYPAGELAGENAALLNIELQYAVPATGPFAVKLGLFTNAGRAARENAVGASDSRSLSEAGVGVYASRGRLFASLQAASRISGKATSESMPRTRALLQLGSTF